MNNKFFVKYKNGESNVIVPKVKKLSDTVSEIELDAQLDYSQVEYVEYDLHAEEIKAGDEGYYLVQAGNHEYANRDYGLGFYKEQPDCEVVLPNCFMPVLGIKHKSKCNIAIVTGMAAEFNQVIKVENNRYYLKVRFMVGQVAPYENIKIEIHNIDKPDATYCDMAREYRNYQLKNGFKPLKERINPELKYSLESVNIRIRMAWKPVPTPIAEQTVENEPEVHVACTFDDVIRLMEAYKKEGIEKVEICLVGWNMKGHDGRWPQIFPVESSIGGEKGLKRVIDKAKELGYAMTCHTNSTDAYSIADIFDEDDIARLPDGGKSSIKSLRWSGGRTYNVCPRRGYEIAMEMLPKVAELGFKGMHYIDVITAIPPRACYDPEHPVDKRESVYYYDKLFKETIRMFGSVGSEGAYDYNLRNCDYTLYVSFADFMNSEARFKLCDKIVPFWQLVYHGIVASNPYSRTINAVISETEDDLLKIIEYGGKPQLYYYARFVDDGTDWIAKGDFHCNTDEESRKVQ